MFKQLGTMHYKEIFLLGSLYAFIAGMLITVFMGTYTQHYRTALLAFVSGILVLLDTLYYLKHKRYILTSLVLLWTSALFVAYRIIESDYGLDMAFLLIPLMVSAILLNKKHLILFSGLYLLFSFALLSYGYAHYPQHPFLHNRSFLIVFGIFTFFVVAFGFIYHYSIEQSYRKLERSDRQKSILLKEVHHRVKNNLNMMTSILGLQIYRYDSPQIREFITQNTQRINAIALLHELLYTESHLEELSARTYINTLAQHIFALGKKDYVTFSSNIDNIQLSLNDMIHIGIIVNELITNSLKYAFGDKEGHISLTLKRIDHRYMLQYRDNGKGIEALKHKQEGFGFSLIALSTEHLEGELQLAPEEHFCCTIYFKGTAQ